MTDLVEVKDELNPKQELFARYYATQEVGTFGNGTQSYMRAYPDSSEESAAVSAYDHLRNPKIVNRLQEIWKSTGVTDEEVDAHLAKLIRQDKDLKSKLGGIKEYNRVKSRGSDIHEHKFDFTDMIKQKKLE